MVQYMDYNLEEIGKSWLCTTLLSFVIWLKTRVSNNPHVKPVKPRGHTTLRTKKYYVLSIYNIYLFTHISV